MFSTSVIKKKTFSLNVYQVKSQIFSFGLQGCFSTSAYLTIYQKVKDIVVKAKGKHVFIILDFSKFTCILRNMKGLNDETQDSLKNITYINHGLSNMSRSGIRSFIPNEKRSKVFEVVDKSAALNLANSLLEKSRTEISAGFEGDYQIVKNKYQIFDKSLELIHNKKWSYKTDNNSYSYRIDMIDGDIFISAPKGQITYENSVTANLLFDDVLDNVLPNAAKYYRIQDYSQVINSTTEAQRDFTRYIISNLDNIGLIVFFGLNRYMKATVKIGKLFLPNTKKVKIVNSLEEALALTVRHKYHITD